MKLKHLIFIFLAFPLLLGLSAIVFAQGGDPLTLFTDNVAATGTTTAITEMEQELLDRLNAATTSIDASIYSLNRVSIRNALIDAHNRGVTVRVVADDDAYDESSYKPHFQALEAAGIPLVLDNRSSLMHNKFFVIDDFVVWSGSTNITDTGFTYNHNNSLVFTSTQLADIFTTEFEEMFSGSFSTAKSDNTTHTLTYAGHPLELYFSPTDGALSELIGEVNAADESIYFSVFFFTDDSLRDAIMARKQAGVTVQGIFDWLGASNQHSEDEALCAVGIPVKIENFGGKMHNKFMVIDVNGGDPVVVTGSMKWTASGRYANDENTLIIHDLDTAQAYVAAFQDLYNALGDETLCNTYRVLLPLVLKAPPSVPTRPVPTPTPVPPPTGPPPSPPPPPTPSQYQFVPGPWYAGDRNDAIVRFYGHLFDTNGTPVNGYSVRAACGNFAVLSFPSGPSPFAPDWPPGWYDIVTDPVSCNWTLQVVEYQCDSPDFDPQCEQYEALSGAIPVITDVGAGETVFVASWIKMW
jgi:phosphatidylserine/phosphatidylglycerophosphate/cardiolipin synthase-like enzyme